MITASATLEEIEPILLEFGRRHAEIERLEIFGSFATGRATPESDLDVLVTFAPDRPSGLDYFGFVLALQEDLELQTGRAVDLVDRGSLNDDLFSYNANLQATLAYERQ
jgi:predicted nucleotidyltransferase